MEPIGSRTELLAATGDDPWARWVIPEDQMAAWTERGVVIVGRDGERRGFWVTPQPDCSEADVLAALTSLRDSGLVAEVGARTLSIDRQWAEVAHRVFDLGTGGDWEWQYSRIEPPAYADPAGLHAVALSDDADAEELNAFARAHNDRIWSTAGQGQMVHWIGLRDGAGDLVAAGGSEREETGIPHLGGILTHTGHRGRGLGLIVTARLTRWALADSGVSSLGMYSDNAAARVVYQRLGYRTAHAWHSRWLTDGPA